jgi:hypothetical protein
MKPTPPLPKRLPKRPQDMTLDRYNVLIESFWSFSNVTGGMSPEDAEEFMNEPGFFALWEPRLEGFMEDETLAASVQRSLRVGVAEGDAALTALAESPEGKAFLARTFPKLPSH